MLLHYLFRFTAHKAMDAFYSKSGKTTDSNSLIYNKQLQFQHAAIAFFITILF